LLKMFTTHTHKYTRLYIGLTEFVAFAVLGNTGTKLSAKIIFRHVSVKHFSNC